MKKDGMAAFFHIAGVVGIARESPPRRRSSWLWAPPQNIFPLKNIPPAFDFFFD